MIFGHFINFGNFPIEIPIEAEKFYGQQKEGSYIKNKNCFENQRPNGTLWNHVEIKIPNFVKIRITLPLEAVYIFFDTATYDEIGKDVKVSFR